MNSRFSIVGKWFNCYLIAEFLLAFSFILFGCQKADLVNPNFGKKSNWQLVKEDSVEFNYQFYAGSEFEGSSNCILLWVPSTSEIKYFNYSTKRFSDSIKASIPNPDLVRTVYSINKDSLLVYPHDFSFKLYQVNKKGSITKTYDLKPKENRPIPRIECSVGESGNYLIRNNILYTAGYSTGESKNVKGKFSAIWLDLNTSQYDYFFEMPRIYFKHYWGGMYYWHTFITGDLFNRIVLSCPNSHKIYCYDINSMEISSFDGGSSFIKKIPPLSKKRIDYRKEIKEEAVKYYYTNYSYGFITFDKYRNVYYRIAQFPNTKFGSENSFTKPSSIIILNNNFDFIGETKINKESTFFSKIIVTKEYIIVPYFSPSKKKNGLYYYKIKKESRE